MSEIEWNPSCNVRVKEFTMQVHHHYIPTKEFTIDVLLFVGTVIAIFVFGLAALPWVQNGP